MAVDGERTGVTYVDDRIQFGSKQRVETEVDNFSADAREALGPTAVNAAKTIISTAFDAIGWRFNTIDGTVAPSPRAVLKLIYVFNVATPPGIKVGHPIKVRHLQCLSALAIRYSLAIVPLRPFSAAFAKNAGGLQADMSATRRLSRPAYADILAWRRALELGTTDPNRLTVRASWIANSDAPPQIQSARADVRIWVDSQGHGGIGVYAPGLAWDGASISDTQYFSSGGQISNNLFEFFAILAGLAIVARTRTHIHVHAHTDNSSALAWAQTCRAESGFHTLLMRVLCDLQVATGIHLTVSHVPGIENVHADAISRQFNVNDGSGLRARIEATAPRVDVIFPLWRIFGDMLKSPSPTPLETDRAVRTALEFVIGTNSAARM
jgi:hypothetical protein